MPLIVVEGMDNTGKTTLAKQLAEKLEGVYLKSPGHASPQDQMQYMRTVGDRCFDEMIISDRWPTISEAIYGSIIRGKLAYNDLSPDDKEEYTDYHEMLWEWGAIIVYCRPLTETIKKNFDQREQMVGVEEKFNELIKAYDEMMRELISSGSIYVYVYHYDMMNVNQLIETMKGDGSIG